MHASESVPELPMKSGRGADDCRPLQPGALVPTGHRSYAQQTDSEHCDAGRLRHSSGADRPCLGTGGAAVGEVGSEVRRNRVAGINCRISNKVVCIETGRSDNLEFQISKVSVACTVAGRAVNRDAVGPVRCVATVNCAKAKHPETIYTLRWMDEVGADTNFRTPDGESERCMWAARVDEAVFRQRQGRIAQVHEHIDGRGVDLRKRHCSYVGHLCTLAGQEDVRGPGEGGRGGQH
jgi:hypothetical protein